MIWFVLTPTWMSLVGPHSGPVQLFSHLQIHRRNRSQCVATSQVRRVVPSGVGEGDWIKLRFFWVRGFEEKSFFACFILPVKCFFLIWFKMNHLPVIIFLIKCFSRQTDFSSMCAKNCTNFGYIRYFPSNLTEGINTLRTCFLCGWLSCYPLKWSEDVVSLQYFPLLSYWFHCSPLGASVSAVLQTRRWNKQPVAKL